MTSTDPAIGDEIRVLLVDDQALLRKGFRMVLEEEPGIVVVGEANDGRAALELVDRRTPDVVVMDVRMPVMDGLEATRAIVDGGAPTRILILTTFDVDEYVFTALRLGASGFLLKDVPPAEFVNAVRAVAAGDAIIAPAVTRRLLDRFAHRLPEARQGDESHPGLGELTAREREILLEVAQGFSNAEVASRLFVAEATVKTHLGRVLAKLGLRDRVHAVIYAHATGLVESTSPTGRPRPVDGAQPQPGGDR